MIGITDEIIDKLQDFPKKVHVKIFRGPKRGTPTGIVEQDSNMLLMGNRIILNKLVYVGKIMTYSTGTNMGRRALLNGKNAPKGQDLLTECETWCRELDLPKVTKGCLDTAMITNAVMLYGQNMKQNYNKWLQIGQK